MTTLDDQLKSLDDDSLIYLANRLVENLEKKQHVQALEANDNARLPKADGSLADQSHKTQLGL